MRKLNNKGFGMTTMIIFIIIFIIILLAIMFVADSNGIGKDSQNPVLEKKDHIFVSPNEEKEEEE